MTQIGPGLTGTPTDKLSQAGSAPLKAPAPAIPGLPPDQPIRGQASAAAGPALAADGRVVAKDVPPTDVALAMKVIRGLALPEKPRIMFRDATRDAWVRDAAFTLARAAKVLDILREAALDPRTPVSDADWKEAKARVQALGAAVAAADKNHVRGEAFEAQFAPHRETLREAWHFPNRPADPKAYAAWRDRGEALMVRAHEAARSLNEIQEDTGVDPFLVRSARGEVLASSSPDHALNALEKRLLEPPPGKLDGLVGFIRAVGEVAAAVEVAPNGDLRARRR